MTGNYSIRYPRKTLIRRLIKIAGRILLPLAARISVTGYNNFPKQGPVILAGNHVAAMEVLMMLVYSPHIVELLGSGDIPIDPTFAPLANLYGFIPINRGNIDQKGLRAALEVLQQGGVLGIFPEGGIWQPAAMQAQTGIAWLSSQANAPVIPIGYGGMKGAVAAIFRFKRPRLTVSVGKAIEPVKVTRPDLSRKAALLESSRMILDRIRELVPVEEQLALPNRYEESFGLAVRLISPTSEEIQPQEELQIRQSAALAKFLCQPVLLDVFVRNLRMKAVRPLQQPVRENPASTVELAARAILDYLEINRGFLTYRFGIDEGIAMREGLKELYDLAHWAAGHGYRMEIQPIRRYRDAYNGEQVEEACIPIQKM